MTKAVKSDIQNLRNLAKSLGGKVCIRTLQTRSGQDAGYYFYEDRCATVYKSPEASWKFVILSLIHEVAHMRGHRIHGNKLLKKAFKHIEKDDKHWPKESRRAFYLLEKRDISMMHKVWEEAGIQSVSLEEVIAEQMFDTAVYEHYWKTGEHLSKIQRNQLRSITRASLGLKP